MTALDLSVNAVVRTPSDQRGADPETLRPRQSKDRVHRQMLYWMIWICCQSASAMIYIPLLNPAI